jgi:hypothetical protein
LAPAVYFRPLLIGYFEIVLPADARWRDVVADQGFHSNGKRADLTAIGLRTYISGPDRGRRQWRVAGVRVRPCALGVAGGQSSGA